VHGLEGLTFCHPIHYTLHISHQAKDAANDKKPVDYLVLGFSVGVADTPTTFPWLEMKGTPHWPAVPCGNFTLSGALASSTNSLTLELLRKGVNFCHQKVKWRWTAGVQDL